MATLKKLPQTKGGWERALSQFNATGNLHKLSSASSASKFGLEEFLALRTLWVEKDLRTLQNTYQDFGMELSHVEGAIEILTNHTPGWDEYLRCIEDNTARNSGEPLPTQAAGFATVFHNQHEILARPSSDEDETKVFRSPINLRFQRRVGTSASQIGGGIASHDAPQTPQRPVPQTMFGSPFDVQSPPDKDIPKPAPAADEQIVNIALVGLLQGLTVHQRRCADWTIRRKIFSCGSNYRLAKFEARTDGALQRHTDQRCMAILEVKARHRAGQPQIQMQESAQMAAWIFTEPESYWEVDRSPEVRHRLLVSQDRDQPLPPDTAESFLKMHQFGGFRITDSKEMKFFGQIILTFLLGPGQVIPPSTAEEPSAKDLAGEPSAKVLAGEPSAKALPVQGRTPLAQRLRSRNRLEDPFQGA